PCLRPPLRPLLDALAGPRRDEAARALDPRAALHLHRREAVAEQLLALLARGLVAGHHDHGAAPGTAERRVDPGLADERLLEPEVLEAAPRDGVIEHALGRARARVHADEKRRVDALLQELRVLRPFVLDDVLAVGVELFRQQRVEGVALAGAVAVHDDDLGAGRGFGTPHRGVDLMRVELAALLVERLARAPLVAPDRSRGPPEGARDEEHH